MDVGKLTLFATLKKRMEWINDRQEILAQNIANADTPRYQPQDLQEYNFQKLVEQERSHVSIATTNSGHIGTGKINIRDFATQKERKPYETAPAGNAVVLEEQLTKMNENQIDHQLTTELYKKQIDLFKIGLGN